MHCKGTIIKDKNEYIATDILTRIVVVGTTRDEALDSLRVAIEEYYGKEHGEIVIDVIDVIEGSE